MKALGAVKGATDKAGDAMRDNASTKIEQFKRTLETNVVNFIGGKAIPAIEALAKWVDGRDRKGVPGSRIVPGRGWRYPVGGQGLADRGGRDPVPELAQLALDAHHAPPAIISGESEDQLREPGGDRRASRRFRLAPLRCDELAVPAQQRVRGDDPVPTQRLRPDVGEAASTARSGHAGRGIGLTRRRIATSCRNARISASLDAEDRARSVSQDSTVTRSR
ncbi:hypothetical protein [Streptomyces sp. NPDC001415]